MTALEHARTTLRELQWCYACGASSSVGLHWHHVVPRALLDNAGTVPLCAECHAKVHDSSLVRATALSKRGAAAARERGITAGRAPYGKRHGQDGRLEADPTEQRVVRKIRQLQKDGCSVASITKQLRAAGAKGRFGRPIARTLVRRIALDAEPNQPGR